MEQLDAPDPLLWDDRRLWFEERHTEFSQKGTGGIDEQAAALVVDLQAAYCAGIWSAVILLAAAAVESQLREHRRRGCKRAEPRAGERPRDLRWLRNLRNRLLHAGTDKAALSIEDHWQAREVWRKRAERAILTTLHFLYPEPGESAKEAGAGVGRRGDG